jgi:hypothetical protein
VKTRKERKMPADLDEMLRLIGEEPIGRSLLNDAAFKHRLAGMGEPSIDDYRYPRFLITALIAAAIGISSQVFLEFNKPLPDLIRHQHLSIFEGAI